VNPSNPRSNKSMGLNPAPPLQTEEEAAAAEFFAVDVEALAAAVVMVVVEVETPTRDHGLIPLHDVGTSITKLPACLTPSAKKCAPEELNDMPPRRHTEPLAVNGTLPLVPLPLHHTQHTFTLLLITHQALWISLHPLHPYISGLSRAIANIRPSKDPGDRPHMDTRPVWQGPMACLHLRHIMATLHITDSSANTPRASLHTWENACIKRVYPPRTSKQKAQEVNSIRTPTHAVLVTMRSYSITISALFLSHHSWTASEQKTKYQPSLQPLHTTIPSMPRRTS
jgi:hypothetical protein